MKWYFRALSAFFLLLLFLFPRLSFAQTTQPLKSHPAETFFTATVTTIKEDGTKNISGSNNPYQKVAVQLLDGPDKGKTYTLEYGGIFIITNEQKVHVGDTVIVSKTAATPQNAGYILVDKYRLTPLLILTAIFFLIIIAIARRKGIGSIVGMLISVGVIFLFIIPQIVNGANPLLISVVGCLAIMVTSIYLAHGFSQQTSVAVAATFLTLVLTAICAILAVKFSQLSGMGSEDAYTLLQGFGGKINFQGLLLGGIMIGALGVLDDVTTTQSTTIYTLADANAKYTVRDLIEKGMIIGREHIASLVNTLVLAYAGASIGVFIYLLLGIDKNVQPLWVMLNSELIVEELIRTLAGSMGLILAVPITTILAAFFSRYSLKIR